MRRFIQWVCATIIALVAEVISFLLFVSTNSSFGMLFSVIFFTCCLFFAYEANLEQKKEKTDAALIEIQDQKRESSQPPNPIETPSMQEQETLIQPLAQEQETPIQPLIQEQETPIPNLPKWMSQWKEVKNLNIQLENEHFFLERRYLDDFSKELISHANSNVLIANPYIQQCDLSDTLRTANRRGVTVKIITRHPLGKTPEYREKLQEYHSLLINEGISITYDDRAHAKLIIVDNAIAVVSSMNFFANSSAGASWEAGLVTMNHAVVESIAESFSKVFNENA